MNKLPNELLIIIFDEVLKETTEEQEQIQEIKRKSYIYQYQENCTYCKNISEKWWICNFAKTMTKQEQLQDLHYQKHREIQMIYNITIRSKEINNKFIKIHPLTFTCRRWR